MIKQLDCIVGIYGINASGKTTISRLLLQEFPISEPQSTDNLLKIFKINNPGHPFSNSSSYTAWKVLGEKTPENIVEGIKGYRSMLQPYIECIAHRVSLEKLAIIFEGVHFDPHMKTKFSIPILPILLIINNREIHRKRIIEKASGREDLMNRMLENMETARVIQEFLISEAQKEGSLIIDTGRFSPEDTIKQITQKIDDIRPHTLVK